MEQRHSALAAGLVSALAGIWTFLVKLLLVRPAGEPRPYRPEKHYMRGPGPKWREKHSSGRVSVIR